MEKSPQWNERLKGPECHGDLYIPVRWRVNAVRPFESSFGSAKGWWPQAWNVDGALGPKRANVRPEGSDVTEGVSADGDGAKHCHQCHRTSRGQDVTLPMFWTAGPRSGETRSRSRFRVPCRR